MKKALFITGIVLALFAAGLFFLLKSNTTAPPEAITEKLNIDIPQSTFNIPIQIEIRSLTDYLNNKLTGQFLETTLFLQKTKKESVELRLTKTENITITSTGRELVCTFPLTVDAILIDSRLGKTLSKLVKPFRTSIIITLATPIDLDSSWRLKTRFKIRDYRWVTEPIIRFGPFKKNIRETLDEAIQKNSPELTSLLDREINKAASLRSTIDDVWQDLQKPIIINKKTAPVWIRFACNDIKGDISLHRSEIICFASVKAKMLIVTDTTNTTSTATDNPLPDFKKIASKDKQLKSDIFIYANTSFAEINQHLNKLLKGTLISSKRYNITINQIHAYASTEGLTVAVETGRDLKGRFYLTGQPLFDVPAQRLILKDFDFSVHTGNILVNKGDEVLHDLLRERVASKLNLGLDTLIVKLPEVINQAIAKEKTGRTIDLRVENLDIKQCDILMGKERIHFIINAGTQTTIRLKKIKAGKAIRIGERK
jgi:hypothetical protein